MGRAGLIVVDSPGHERVLVKGSLSKPAWSYDGKWLAFQRDGTVQGELAQQDLWVVPTRGGASRKLLANVVQWSWSRSNPSALAAYTDNSAADLPAGVTASDAYVVFADGSLYWKVPLPGITGVAWANHNGALAIATGGPSGPRLYLASLFSPVPVALVRVAFHLANPPTSYTLLLDRFTSDDRAVLGWVDEMGSGSIALDGIPLIAIPTAGGNATRLPTMLVDPAWVRDAPTGTDMLVVASSGRIVTGERQIRRCDSAGQCIVPFVDGVQTMDPAWAPDGSRIAYVRSDAPHDFPRPDGGPVPNWPGRYAKRHLWIADADGGSGREILTAGDGVAVIAWSDAKHVTVVTGGRLRSVEVATGRSVALTGMLGESGMTLPPEAVYEPTPLNGGPDGFTSWESLVALAP